MGKSSSAKKRRQRQRRRAELDRIRGLPLLDTSSPGPSPSSAGKQHPSFPPIAEPKNNGSSRKVEEQKTPHKNESLPRKRIDFVLPRSLGKVESYIFDKHSRPINESLATIPEDPDEKSSLSVPSDLRNETIDDIFRKAKKAVSLSQDGGHQQSTSTTKQNPALHETTTVNEGQQTLETQDIERKAGKNHKKKRKRSSSDASISRTDQPVSDSGADKRGLSTGISKPIESETAEKVLVAAEGGIAVRHAEGSMSGRSVEEAVRDRVGMRPRANSTDGELNLPQGGLCDERVVLASYKWHLDDSLIHRSSPKGLANLGNTCFLNSTLQCLAYLPPFCQSLAKMTDSAQTTTKNNYLKPSQGQKITRYLRSLFERLHGFDRDASFTKSVAPNELVRALPNLGSIGSRNGYKFRPGRQEDAHEFLVHLLDAMHDGELRAAGINQHASGWRGRLPAPRIDETTFVHRIFGGYLRSQVKCTDCGYCSNTYDPFLDLSLEVSKKSCRSVAHAFAEFTRKETLDSANRYKCSGCKRRVCATKQLTVFRPPLSLCVQLKRFSFGDMIGGGYGSWKHGGGGMMGGKISKQVQFPSKMDLPLSDGRSCPYALSGVVIHVGGSASSGHYTAYVRRPDRKGLFQWYHMDDSYVEAVSEKSVLMHKDAYLLFYSRTEVRLEFPSPPPRSSMTAEEARAFGKARAKARADSVGGKESKDEKIGDQIIHNKNIRADRSPTATTAATSNDIRIEKLDCRATSVPRDSAARLPGGQSKTSDSMAESLESTLSRSATDHAMPNSTESGQGNTNDSASESSSSESSGSSSSSESASSELIAKDAATKSAESGHGNTAASASQSSPSESTVSSSSSGSDSSDDDSRVGREIESAVVNKRIATKASLASNESKKTKIILKGGTTREKIEVMMGPRKRGRKWESKTVMAKNGGKELELLGNRRVQSWSDDDPDPRDQSRDLERKNVVNALKKTQNKRKRKMIVDRWDALLDQGKQKKVKKSATSEAETKPRKNVFQKIQSSVQRVNKGVAKTMIRPARKILNRKKNSKASF